MSQRDGAGGTLERLDAPASMIEATVGGASAQRDVVTMPGRLDKQLTSEQRLLELPAEELVALGHLQGRGEPAQVRRRIGRSRCRRRIAGIALLEGRVVLGTPAALEAGLVRRRPEYVDACESPICPHARIHPRNAEPPSHTVHRQAGRPRIETAGNHLGT